jgi:hypothetical protein
LIVVTIENEHCCFAEQRSHHKRSKGDVSTELICKHDLLKDSEERNDHNVEDRQQKELRFANIEYSNDVVTSTN